MSNKPERFTPEARDGALRRLRHMTVSLAAASFAMTAVFGIVAHTSIPGKASQTVASILASGNTSYTGSSTTSSTSTSSSSSTHGSTSAGSTSSGTGVAVSGVS